MFSGGSNPPWSDFDYPKQACLHLLIEQWIYVHLPVSIHQPFLNAKPKKEKKCWILLVAKSPLEGCTLWHPPPPRSNHHQHRGPVENHSFPEVSTRPGWNARDCHHPGIEMDQRIIPKKQKMSILDHPKTSVIHSYCRLPDISSLF